MINMRKIPSWVAAVARGGKGLRGPWERSGGCIIDAVEEPKTGTLVDEGEEAGTCLRGETVLSR